jgi:hypothetical protein
VKIFSAEIKHGDCLEVLQEYGKVINRFTAEFIKDFCQPDGAILWDKLVQFNSSRE